MSNVSKLISKVENKKRQADASELIPILEKASGYEPYVSGKIVCFGSYHYKYASGREGDSAVVAFAPRKQNLVVYIMPGFSSYQEILKKLGKFKTGSSCLYINKLEDIDLNVLKKLVQVSVQDMQKKYVCKKIMKQGQ